MDRGTGGRVRLPGAERSILILLVAFAVAVIATRWFLAWTGYPRVGGGELHIAHALWGGALLFVGALVPLIWTGRLVHELAAALIGAGAGLFIDEVGKFITAGNDYFYPAAAPIVYATFLLCVLGFLRLRATERPDHEHDVSTPPSAPARALPATSIAARERAAWHRRHGAWLGGRGFRALILIATFLAGLGSFAAMLWVGFFFVFVIPPSDLPLFTLMLAYVVIDGVSGFLMLAGAVALATRRTSSGVVLASAGLVVALVLGDVLSFYLRQFDSIVIALSHLGLLLGVGTLHGVQPASHVGPPR